MKKHIFLSITFFIFVILLSGCLLPKADYSDKEVLDVTLINKCNWAMKVTLKATGIFETYELNQEPLHINLYKDVEYEVMVKGVYDSNYSSIKIITDAEHTIWTIDWSLYTGSYNLNRKKPR